MDNIILKKKITELKEDQILNYLNLIQSFNGTLLLSL